MELWEVTHTTPQPAEWEHIRQQGKKLACVVQQWQRFYSRHAIDEQRIDLEHIVNEVRDDFLEGDRPIDIATPHSSEPLWIMGDAVGVRHLLQLITDDLLNSYDRAALPCLVLSIQTTRSNSSAVVTIRTRMSDGDHAEAGVETPETHSDSLIHAACRSLAMRLDAHILRQRDADGCVTIQVEFPLCT
jgi:hypothetical protein